MVRSFFAAALLAVITILAPLSVSAASCVTVPVMLSRGMSDASTGGAVSTLQLYLGVEQSGYFGPATEAAVQELQSRLGIIAGGDAATTGYGMVGPRTIAAIACGAGEVLGASTSAAFTVGDRVKVTESGVRNLIDPSLVYSWPATLSAGAIGTVIGGPNTLGATVRWQIDFDVENTGWVAEQYLAKIVAIPAPNPTPVMKSCTWEGKTVAHGASVTAYNQYSVPSGHSCLSQTRTCNNGVLSGTYPATTCSLGTGKSCTWDGKTVVHGASITAYEQYSVPSDHTCRTQTRTCDDGVLSGTYPATTCKVEGLKSCTWAGGTVASGASVTAYQQYSVPSGHSCVSQKRTCTNGVLSGSYVATSCTLGPGKSCTFNGAKIAHGTSVTAYVSEKVAPGRTCTSETRTCDDGVLSGSYGAASCKVRSAKACTFNEQSIPDGGMVTAFSKSKVGPTGTCLSETRTCSDGTLSGTYTEAKCKVRPARACTFDGKSIPSGETVTAYKTKKVGPTNTCVSEVRTCNDGKLSGTYSEPACKVRTARSCTFDGKTLESGASVTAYQQASVPVGNKCISEKRICNDSTLSGTFTSAACVVQQPGAVGAITGVIWNDRDADVVRDSNESGFAGQIVQLLKNGIKVKEVATDGSGSYSFPNLQSNTTYRVTHPVRDLVITGGICNGKKCSSSDHSVEVAVKPGATATIDYGMRVPTGKCTVTLRDFGAKGDGVTDDTNAYEQAVQSKCSIDGENLKYKISRFIQIEDRKDFTLRNASFVNGISTGDRRVVYVGRSDGVTLSNLTFDRGSNPYLGSARAGGDLYISASKNVLLKDIEVFGDGAGQGIIVAGSEGVDIRNINIHDMRWASYDKPVHQYEIVNGNVSPGGEKMAGLSIGGSKHVTIEDITIRNLTPHTVDTISYGGTMKYADNMTDAIGISGVTDLTIRNAKISNVGEGIDMSGTLAPRDFLIEDVTVENTGGSCIKSSRGPSDRGGPGVIRDSVVRNCGRDGYIIVGNLGDITFDNDLAENVGVNKLIPGGLALAAGFNINYAYKPDTIPYEVTGWPINITIKNSTARDTQAVHTMTHAFVDYVQPHHGKPNNQLINSKGSGYTKAEVVGFDD